MGQGDKGEKGEQGVKGETGAKGTDGAKGEAGDKGAEGEKGEQGMQGDKGVQGEQGEQGIKGDKGETGRSIFRGEFQGFTNGGCPEDYEVGDLVSHSGNWYRLESMPSIDEPPCTNANRPGSGNSPWVNLEERYRGNQGPRIYRGEWQEYDISLARCPEVYLEGDIVKFDDEYYRLESDPSTFNPCQWEQRPTSATSRWVNLRETYQGAQGVKGER